MPTIPSGFPTSFLAPIHQAYGAGLQSARGLPTTVRLPLSQYPPPRHPALLQDPWTFLKQTASAVPLPWRFANAAAKATSVCTVERPDIGHPPALLHATMSGEASATLTEAQFWQTLGDRLSKGALENAYYPCWYSDHLPGSHPPGLRRGCPIGPRGAYYYPTLTCSQRDRSLLGVIQLGLPGTD